MPHLYTSCLELLSRLAGSAAALENASATDSDSKQLQQQVAAASTALWEEIRVYQEIVSLLTPNKLALLQWKDNTLITRARALGVGYKCTADAVEDVQLKQLLDTRQAAYVALAMAAHRWQAVWDLYEKLQKLGEALYEHGTMFLWETWAVRDLDLYKRWEQWAEALSMVPGAELYQRLYDGLPSDFKRTLQQCAEAHRKATEVMAMEERAEAQRATVPKQKCP